MNRKSISLITIILSLFAFSNVAFAAHVSDADLNKALAESKKTAKSEADRRAKAPKLSAKEQADLDLAIALSLSQADVKKEDDFISIIRNNGLTSFIRDNVDVRNVIAILSLEDEEFNDLKPADVAACIRTEALNKSESANFVARTLAFNLIKYLEGKAFDKKEVAAQTIDEAAISIGRTLKLTPVQIRLQLKPVIHDLYIELYGRELGSESVLPAVVASGSAPAAAGAAVVAPADDKKQARVIAVLKKHRRKIAALLTTEVLQRLFVEPAPKAKSEKKSK